MNNLEFAINMEHDGEKFYKRQAEINKDNSLNTVFLLLEKDEAHHARILQNKFNELTDNNTLSQVNNVFKESKGFISEFEKIPNQLDAYKFALEIERKSIDLYTSFLSESTMINQRNYLNSSSNRKKIITQYLKN